MWISEDKKIISLEKRKHDEALKFMNEFLKNNLQTGIPKGLQADFMKGFKVFVGNRNLSKSIKEAISDLISTDGTIFYSN
jgi:tRNA nucleotidyltransferase (CCA-adding enzyme)